MSAPVLDVRIEGAERWQRRLQNVEGRLEDFRPLGEQLEPVIYGRFGRWLSAEGEGTWQPLSPGYAAWKAKKYPGRRIMVQTGALAESLTDRNGQFSVRRVDRRGGEWGTRVPYAQFHDKGTKRAPKRRIIIITTAFRKDIVDVMRDYGRDAVRRSA